MQPVNRLCDCKSHKSKVKSTRLWVLIFASAILISLAYIIIPSAIDWKDGFRPAAIAAISGESPYEAPGTGFFNPPWVLFLFVPLSLLPIKLGGFFLTLVGFFSYLYISQRFNRNPIVIAAFILSPPVMLDLAYANINWLVILGYLLPSPIGLFLVMLKPQVGLGVIIYWFVEAWCKGKVREVIRVFGPVTLAYFVSYLVFGPWFLKAPSLFGSLWNANFWPLSIPFGFLILFRSLSRRNIRYAYSAGPFLSPYVAIYSWSTALVSLLPNKKNIY